MKTKRATLPPPDPLNAATLRKMACHSCTSGGTLYFHGRCHPQNATWCHFNAQTGSIVIQCSMCSKLIAEVAVDDPENRSQKINDLLRETACCVETLLGYLPKWAKNTIVNVDFIESRMRAAYRVAGPKNWSVAKPGTRNSKPGTAAAAAGGRR